MCIIICYVITTLFLLFIISFNLCFKDATCIRVQIKMFIISCAPCNSKGLHWKYISQLLWVIPDRNVDTI